MSLCIQVILIEPTSVEVSSEQRDLRLQLRTMSMDALRLAEDSEDNSYYGVVYTPEILRLMLFAYTDNHGFMRPTNKAHVRLLFRERTAWQLGTTFRSVWCAFTVLQVGQKSKDGRTCEEIDHHNQNSDTLGINLFALFFQVCRVLIALVLQSCDTPCCALILSLLLPQGVVQSVDCIGSAVL